VPEKKPMPRHVLTMNNLGGAFRFTKEVGGAAIVGGAELSGMGKLAPSVLGKIANKIPSIYGISAGVGSFFGALKYAGLGTLVRRPGKSMDIAKKAFKGAYRRVSEFKPSVTGYASTVISGLDAAGMPGRKKLGIFSRAIKGYKGHPKMNMLEKALNLRPAILSDKAIHNITKGSRDAVVWEKQLRHMSKGGIPLYDKGIYKGAHGLIDLRNINPKRVLDRSLNFLVDFGRLHVGGTNISIPGLFKMDTIAAYSPTFRLLKPGDSFAVGRGIETKGFKNLSDKILRGRGIYQVQPDHYGLFVDGSFYNVQKNPLQEGGSLLRRVTPKGVKFKMFQSGESDAFGEVAINRAMGLSAEGRKAQQYSLESDIGGVRGFLAKTLDIKKFTTTGVFGHIKGVLNKVFHQESPLRLKALEDAALTNKPGMRDAFIRTIRRTLKKSSTLASKLFRNPEILRNIGVDIDMAPEALIKNVDKEASMIQLAKGANIQGERLLKNYNIKHLLNNARDDIHYRTLKSVAKKTTDGYVMSGREQMLEFLAASKLLKNGAGAGSVALNSLTETMMNKGLMNEQQASSLRVWLTRHIFEANYDAAGQKATPDFVKDVSGMLKNYDKDMKLAVESVYTKGMKMFTEPFHRVESSMEILRPELKPGGYSIIPRGDSDPVHFFAEGDPSDVTSLYGFWPGIGEKSSLFNNVFSEAAINRSARLFEWFGLGLDPKAYKTGADLFTRGVMMKRVLPIAGAINAWDIADKLTDQNPLFDGTVFDEGLNTAIAEQGVKGRMLFARVNDDLGITDSAKYAEGLMPGFIDSPFMRAMRGAVVPIAAGAKIGGIWGGPAGAGYGMLMGIGLGATQGFGAFDITKSQDELEEIYSGREEVPYRKGRWWLLSSGQWKGNRTQMFTPNWFARTKSKYKSTPEGLGNPLEQLLYKPLPILDFNPLGYVLGGSRRYAFRHYYSQPFPMTGVPFSEFPIIGPTLAATVGRTILPPREMHKEEVDRALSSMGYAGRGHGDISAFKGGAVTIGGGDNPLIPGTAEMRGVAPMSASGVKSTIDKQLYNLTEYMGLWGFGAETMSKKMLGFARTFEDNPVLASSNDITSFRRAFWDQNMGDPTGACFLSDTDISTDNGLKKIIDVNVGDKVLSLDGELHNVVDKIHKKASDLYKMKLATINTELIGTSKHHIPIFKRTRCIDSSHKNTRPCIPGNKAKCLFCSRRNSKIEVCDTNIKDIKPGDYCVVPIVKPKGKEYVIDLSKYTDRYHDNEFMYSNNIKNKQRYISYIKARKLLSSNFYTRKELRDHGISDKIAKDAIREHRRGVTIYKFNRYVKIDESISYLLGWYAAEGYVEKGGRVSFVMNKNEIAYAKQILEIVRIKFGSFGTLKVKNNTLILRIQCIPLSILATQLCGKRAENKKIDYIIKSSSKKIVSEFFKGVQLGDGYSNIKKAGFHSCSSNFVKDVFDIGLILGFYGNLVLNYHDKGGGLLPQGTIRKPGISSYIHWNKQSSIGIYNLLYDKSMDISDFKNGNSFIYDNKLFIKVKKVEQLNDKNVDVYDLQIQDLNYYVAEGIAVHNTELWRRLVPRPRGMSGEIETVNPICLTEDSMIVTKNMKVVKIQDIQKGANVFGFDYTKVIKKSSRLVNEKVYKIRLYNNFENVWLTHNHPLYVIKTKFCHSHPERNIVCVKNRLYKSCGTCGYNTFNEKRYKTRQQYRDYKPEWKNIEDISKYDFVGYPILKTDECYQTLDCDDFMSEYYNRNDGDKIWKYNGQGCGKRYNRFIELDYNFGFICGLYLSEGSSSSKGHVVKFALHKDERNTLALDILKWFKNKNIKGNIYKASLNGIEIDIYSTFYNKLFSKLFGSGAKNKYIDDFILYHFPKEFILGLFHGHFEGDGSIKSNVCAIKSSSPSLSLILSLRNLLLQFKCVSCVHLYKPTGSYHLTLLSEYEEKLVKLLNENYGYKIKIKNKKLRNNKKSSWHRHFFEDDILFTMVTDVQTKHYNGNVYDIQVEKGESFTTPFMLLHNCNRMPSWMTQKYKTGNPFSKIPMGELLLPGLGHETAFDINFTWPAMGEMMGMSVPDVTRMFLGLYPKRGLERATSELDRKNREIMAGANVYDAYNNISGAHDGIIRGTRGKSVQKIKNLSDSELNSFIGPTEQDISEINFYMKQTGTYEGNIQYQWRGKPVAMHPATYSEKRYDRDIAAVRQARHMAGELYSRGLGFGTEGYSHIDRLNILANTGPYSPEYKQELDIVKAQMMGGYDHEDRLNKILKKRKAIMMKEELFPYRFRGKVLTPDSEYNNMSLNEDIKAASEYSLPERFMGSVWETVSHADLPFSRKFFPYRTPLEAYKRDMLYGRSVKMWSEPYDHWIDAYSRGFMSKTTAFQGSIPGAWAGTLVGGPGLGTAAGAAVGAAYGLVHGVVNDVTGSTYIPASVRKGREINRYFDQLTYTKNNMLYQMTGDEQYLDEARGTMMGLLPSDKSGKGWTYMYRATPPQEKQHIVSFLQTTDPEERDNILKYVPAETGHLLETKWNAIDGRAIDMVVSKQQVSPMPHPNSAVYAPEVPIDDVKLVTVENEGLQSHDFGLGHYRQARRVANSPGIMPINMENPTGGIAYTPTQNYMEIKRTIEIALDRAGVHGSISLTPSLGGSNRVMVYNT